MIASALSQRQIVVLESEATRSRAIHLGPEVWEGEPREGQAKAGRQLTRHRFHGVDELRGDSAGGRSWEAPFKEK